MIKTATKTSLNCEDISFSPQRRKGAESFGNRDFLRRERVCHCKGAKEQSDCDNLSSARPDCHSRFAPLLPRNDKLFFTSSTRSSPKFFARGGSAPSRLCGSFQRCRFSSSVCEAKRATRFCQSPRAVRIFSTTSRTAPRPPRARVT